MSERIKTSALAGFAECRYVISGFDAQAVNGQGAPRKVDCRKAAPGLALPARLYTGVFQSKT